MGTFVKPARATQDFLHCLPRKEHKQRELERIPGHLIAHFEGLTEDQVRSATDSLNTAIVIDLIDLDDGLLLFQVPSGEEESLISRLMELPCFTSCEHATR